MKSRHPSIQLVSLRKKVEIHLPDGRVLSGPRGAAVGDFLGSLPEFADPPIVGAVINNELRELTYPVEMDALVRPVNTSESDGALIYRRSLTFLLEAAFRELHPGSSLAIDHSVASGGYYCQVGGRTPLTKRELVELETLMLDLVQRNLTFEKKKVPLVEAVTYFAERGEVEKTRLLKYRTKDHLILYSLGNYRDYHHGYMVPSTGFIKWFGLLPYGEGFILRFPRRHAPTTLLPTPESPKMLKTFQQYGNWLKRLDIECVGALNDAIAANRIRQIILVSEALHEQKIAEIATQIVERSDRARVVLVAGPSSSGKTTFSKRLAVQLLAQGIAPFPLEMDNYFIDREHTPRDENGQYDFESIKALNIALLQEHLHRLLDGDEVQLPHYDFRLGASIPGDVVQLKRERLIILEGIHGLNPRLLPDFPAEETFRVYVSCLTQLNLDRQNRISTTDTRLIRRIVRDAATRGYTAHQTIQRWESVRRGEKRYIFTFQENADEIFNSALAYELSALKPLAEPLLRQVPFGVPEYVEAKRLLSFLEWFSPLNRDLIPDNSILREFIGGSILSDFSLWQIE